MTSAGPSDPVSWNRYSYTGGDPINRLDPSGSETFSFVGWQPADGSLPDPISISENCFSLAAYAATGVNPVAQVFFSLYCVNANVGGGGGGASDNGRNCTAGSASAVQYIKATGRVAAMTPEFFTGAGPTNLTFDPTSATSQVMAQSAGVRAVLNDYYVLGQTSGLYTFGAPGYVAAGANPVAQFVGSFTWSISSGVLSLTNITSFRSLALDNMWPSVGTIPHPLNIRDVHIAHG